MTISNFFKPTCRFSLSFYFGLRGLQIGSSAIAGFSFCYLIWQHNHHYCAYDYIYCTPWQRREAVVPTVYIWLVTAIVATILAAFILSYKHLSSILNTFSGTATGRITLPTSTLLPSPDDDETYTLITRSLQSALNSVPNTALILDTFILIILLLSFAEYSQTMILGPVIPYCYLWKPSHDHSYEYWKNLKVINKECIISQCAWVTCIFVMGFSAIIVILDGYYLRCEWAEKKVAVGAPSEVLAQTAASENVEAKW